MLIPRSSVSSSGALATTPPASSPLITPAAQTVLSTILKGVATTSPTATPPKIQVPSISNNNNSGPKQITERLVQSENRLNLNNIVK